MTEMNSTNPTLIKPYADLREYLEVLEQHGKLKRITRELDTDC
jgi:3-polyprenyl-4-hydroxybenzoate decarboxylase